MFSCTSIEIENFVIESNKIERIFRDPTQQEIDEFIRFINLPKIDVGELQRFVAIYQPGALLRDQFGLDVRVGSFYPPFGSPEIRHRLNAILESENGACATHIRYETLHPFTDCNGRSGRALWAWKRKSITGGFLLNFYYETLALGDLTEGS